MDHAGRKAPRQDGLLLVISWTMVALGVLGILPGFPFTRGKLPKAREVRESEQTSYVLAQLTPLSIEQGWGPETVPTESWLEVEPVAKGRRRRTIRLPVVIWKLRPLDFSPEELRGLRDLCQEDEADPGWPHVAVALAPLPPGRYMLTGYVGKVSWLGATWGDDPHKAYTRSARLPLNREFVVARGQVLYLGSFVVEPVKPAAGSEDEKSRRIRQWYDEKTWGRSEGESVTMRLISGLPALFRCLETVDPGLGKAVQERGVTAADYLSELPSHSSPDMQALADALRAALQKKDPTGSPDVSVEVQDGKLVMRIGPPKTAAGPASERRAPETRPVPKPQAPPLASETASEQQGAIGDLREPVAPGDVAATDALLSKSGGARAARQRPRERVQPPPEVNAQAVIWRTPEPPMDPQAGDVWVDPKGGMEMVYIAPGEFILGSSDAHINAWLTRHPEYSVTAEDFADEQPQCRVDLPGYWIGRTEVTNAQYLRFVRATGHRAPEHWKGGQVPSGLEAFPAAYVSWEDAQAYCEWAGCRLPAELEWEKAARGTDARVFPWGDQWDQDHQCRNFGLVTGRSLEWQSHDWLARMAVWRMSHDDARDGPAAVRSYAADASPYGCLDMAGNVAEWCADWYEEQAYQRYAKRELTPPASGDYKVRRGGDWDGFILSHFRCAGRNYCRPNSLVDVRGVGFRCARGPL